VVAVFASACCAGPAALAALGATGFTFSSMLMPYRIHLLAGSLALLAIGFLRLRRADARCAADEACPPRAGRAARLVLWLSVVIWVASAVAYAATEVYNPARTEAQAATYATLDEKVEPLRAAFNQNADKVRVVMLVAPT
jgi:hypothetical protein